MAVVMMCRPFRRPYSAAVRTAQLSPSVPQEVKTSSSGAQPRRPATAARCSFSAAAAACPRAYPEEGLPYPSVMASRAARAASGHTRVVAALSKYTGMVRSPHPWME